MDPNTFPTKGNLILAKNSLALAKQGYVLMDKKRNILIRELMGLIQQAESIQKEIDSTFRMAYAALQMANIKLSRDQKIHPDVRNSSSSLLQIHSGCVLRYPDNLCDRAEADRLPAWQLLCRLHLLWIFRLQSGRSLPAR